MQCLLCGTYQHLQCHGLQQPPNVQWRCLRCLFVIDGQREFSRGYDCPIMGCSFSTRHRKFIDGYEAQLSHFLSHEDVNVTCTLCTTSGNDKPPTFTHARVYRVHLGLVHGANALVSSFPGSYTPASLVPIAHNTHCTSFPVSCSLCENKLASFAELADHVELCSARIVIDRAMSRKMLVERNLWAIDDSNWGYDHNAPSFGRRDITRENRTSYETFKSPIQWCRWNPRPGDVLCPGKLPPFDCRAGCYGAPKGMTKDIRDDHELYLHWTGRCIANVNDADESRSHTKKKENSA